MGRDANPGLRTIVHKNVSRQQFAADFISVRTVNGNRSAALLRVLGRVDLPPAGTNAFEKARGHTDRFLSNGMHADFVYDFKAGPASIQSRDVRCAVSETVRVFARINFAWFELKRT